MTVERIDLAEFHRRIKAQNAPAHEDFAFKCPMCGTVQSARTLILAGAGGSFDEVEKYVGFSCVGRFTNAGPPPANRNSGRACNWTLGGLFRLHNLEVVAEDNTVFPTFEPVNAEECLQLAARAGRLEAQPNV